MIRKPEEYNQALNLRRKGKSIREIARLLSISPSTVSVWCKDIILSIEQKNNLLRSKSRILHLRKLAAESHQNKVLRVKNLVEKAEEEIGLLTKKELFLIGVALYWGEGFKSLKEGRMGFCNSDPRMIKFMMKWFKEALKIKSEDFIFRTEFNQSHKDREEKIKFFWSRLVRMPLDQFEKSYYHKSVWLRAYPNRDDYFGILRIRIRKSSVLLNKTKGWINGLALAT